MSRTRIAAKISSLKAENERLKVMVLAARKEAEESDLAKIQAENQHLRQMLLAAKESIKEHRQAADQEQSKRKVRK